MKKRITRFLLMGCVSISMISSMQAVEGKGFFDSLKSISSQYFSELSSLSQVSLSNQLAALRAKEVVLASDRKQRNTVYKKIVQSVRSLRAQARKECVRGVAYLKTDSGKKTMYETALFTMLMAGGYKLWLQNQQTQQQLAAMQRDVNQTQKDAETLQASYASVAAGYASAASEQVNILGGVARVLQNIDAKIDFTDLKLLYLSGGFEICETEATSFAQAVQAVQGRLRRDTAHRKERYAVVNSETKKIYPIFAAEVYYNTWGFGMSPQERWEEHGANVRRACGVGDCKLVPYYTQGDQIHFLIP